MKYLIVVDMQRDFVDGVLGSKEAQAIVPAIEKKIREFCGTVIFTRDTHQENYLETQEGNYLPVVHCIEGTTGWELVPSLEALRKQRHAKVFDKPNFGSLALAEALKKQGEQVETIELVGVCTDICVVSNALLLKATLPEVPIYVDASCCAGVTPESHEAALQTMRSCQIQV